MSETKNEERGASGEVVPTAWVCEGCGDCREQIEAPRGCLTCERWAERTGKQVPDLDWSPLLSIHSVQALVDAAYLRGVADGERGSMLGAGRVEVTK